MPHALVDGNLLPMGGWQRGPRGAGGEWAGRLAVSRAGTDPETFYGAP